MSGEKAAGERLGRVVLAGAAERDDAGGRALLGKHAGGKRTLVLREPGERLRIVGAFR